MVASLPGMTSKTGLRGTSSTPGGQAQHLDRGLAVDHGGHDVPAVGGRLLADHDEVAVADRRLDHRIALDPQGEQRAWPTRLSGRVSSSSTCCSARIGVPAAIAPSSGTRTSDPTPARAPALAPAPAPARRRAGCRPRGSRERPAADGRAPRGPSAGAPPRTATQARPRPRSRASWVDNHAGRPTRGSS